MTTPGGQERMDLGQGPPLGA